MIQFYFTLILILFLSACGQREVAPKNSAQKAGPSQGRTKVEVISDSGRPIVISPDSTASFTPTSFDAKYADCNGALMYNVNIYGTDSSSIGLSANTVPELNHWYIDDHSIYATNVPNPSIGAYGIELPSFNNYVVWSSLLFTVTESGRLAFTFQLIFKNGKKLNGTVDIPVGPGRQVNCK